MCLSHIFRINLKQCDLFDLDNTILMCPGIDAIDADTFQYIFTNKTMVGYFDWNLDFKWHAKNDFSWEIYDMPAMSGGLFAIHKKFFETLGFYDPGKLPALKLTVHIHQLLAKHEFL